MLLLKETGEIEAYKLVSYKYNNSVDQYEYTINKANGFAYLDFALEGSSKIQREYFVLEGNRIFMADTFTERGQVIKTLADKYPEDFRRCLYAYDRVKEIAKDNSFEYKMFMEYLDRAKSRQGNSYIWEELESQSHKINRINEKVFKELYSLPQDVQELVEVPMRKYIKVDLSGSKHHYTGTYSFMEDYPQTDYSGIR